MFLKIAVTKSVTKNQFFPVLANKKGLHFCKPLFYMVGLFGLEPKTKGLLVLCYKVTVVIPIKS